MASHSASVADNYDSDQSVYEEIDENFCEPPAKQTKNPDHILLYVPRNIASTSQVVMATDQRKISSNALNDIIASIIIESRGRSEDFVHSETSTLKGRQKFRCKKVDNAQEKFLVDVDDNHYSAFSRNTLR